MQYKTGDIVWYLDRTPRIQKRAIKQKYGSIEHPYYCLVDEPPQFTLYGHQLQPTKEALLAAIDPPLHNFAVGQTVWYTGSLKDQTTLLVQKVIIREIADHCFGVTTSIDHAGNFYVALDTLFDNPQDAVAKALELKQW